jgi:hypothetical protein
VGAALPSDTRESLESWRRDEPSASPSSSAAVSERALTYLACTSTTSSVGLQSQRNSKQFKFQWEIEKLKFYHRGPHDPNQEFWKFYEAELVLALKI